MSEFSKRLKTIRLTKGIKQKEIASFLGVTQTAVSDYESGKRHPPLETITKLAKRYNASLNWLLTGEGPMFQELQEVDGSFLGDTISVPVVGEIAAGEPAELFYEEPYSSLDIPRALLSFAPPYVVFRVSGDSMSPHVLPGDLVVCSEDWREVDTNGKIMAFRCEDGITLKKLVEDIKRKVTMLVPLNSHYEPMIYIEGDPDIVMIGILDLCIRRYNRE